MVWCTRSFVVAAAISVAILIWYVVASSRGAVSPTIWTGLATSACMGSWLYCIADWHLRKSNADHSPRSTEEAEAAVRQLRSSR